MCNRRYCTCAIIAKYKLEKKKVPLEMLFSIVCLLGTATRGNPAYLKRRIHTIACSTKGRNRKP